MIIGLKVRQVKGHRSGESVEVFASVAVCFLLNVVSIAFF